MAEQRRNIKGTATQRRYDIECPLGKMTQCICYQV